MSFARSLPTRPVGTSCDDLDFITLTADQNGTARPQGSARDLGAIEADYLFVNPFE